MNQPYDLEYSHTHTHTHTQGTIDRETKDRRETREKKH